MIRGKPESALTITLVLSSKSGSIFLWKRCRRFPQKVHVTTQRITVCNRVFKVRTRPRNHWKSETRGGRGERKSIYQELGLMHFLKRTIVLIPIHNEDSKHTIKPLVPIEDANLLYIGYCNKLFQRNIFISVFPKL